MTQTPPQSKQGILRKQPRQRDFSKSNTTRKTNLGSQNADVGQKKHPSVSIWMFHNET